LAIILNNLGIVALHTGNYGAAAVYYEESLALDLENGNTQAEAAVRNNLGELAMFQGDYERADAQYAISLRLRRDLGDRWGISSVLNNFGCSKLHQGDYGKAVALLEESLVLKRAIGDRWAISNSLLSLATATLLLNDIPRSAEMLKESLTLTQEIEDEGSIGVALIGIGSVSAAVGNFVWAARLMAAGMALLDKTGLSRAISVGDQAELDRVTALINSGISGEAKAAAEREGLALTAPDVMAHFDEAVSPPRQPAGIPVPTSILSENAQKEGLTARETEVLKLIADGLSYGQIAEKLFISTRTVDAHLRSIYSKLQVRSRHEATRYAFEHHLF
jgi:ATP/maltotriose-dependent transcriptional regulator MalT